MNIIDYAVFFGIMGMSLYAFNIDYLEHMVNVYNIETAIFTFVQHSYCKIIHATPGCLVLRCLLLISIFIIKKKKELNLYKAVKELLSS